MRSKLHIKPKELSEKSIQALWCVLDADDSNSIHMDEFSRFLRGAIGGPVASRSSSRPASKGMRSPKAIRREEEEKARRAIQRAADREARLAWHHQYMRERAVRLAAEREAQMAYERSRERSIAKSMQLSRHKRNLLAEMRLNVFKSPIPDDNGGRLGGGRILPLYQSERLLARMERDTGVQRWPSRPRSPRKPSTPLVAELGRLEDILVSPTFRQAVSRYPHPVLGGALQGKPTRAERLRQEIAVASAPPGLRPLQASQSLPSFAM